MTLPAEITARPYQEVALTLLQSDFDVHKRVLCVAPAGSGKTTIGALLITRTQRWKRVLWLAHRTELIDQARQRLSDLGLHVGVMMASYERLHPEHVVPDAPVQVGSVQTVERRGVPPNVDLLVFDEAHRTMADSYQRIAASCPDAYVLGLTATPCRLDGRGLGDFYTYMEIIAQPSELYGRYLAEPRTFSAPLELLTVLYTKMRSVRMRLGDYDAGDLGRAVSKKTLIGGVVSEAMRLAPKAKKIVFACSVQHSKQLVREFQRCGVSAAHLDGHTSQKQRAAMLSRLRNGTLEVICNVDVLSEGWDLPALGAVIVARPTASLSRFLQQVGRCWRWDNLKSLPIVIDHGANFDRFELYPSYDMEWTLQHGVETTTSRKRARICQKCLVFMPRSARKCPHCGAPCPKRGTPDPFEKLAELEEVSRRGERPVRDLVLLEKERVENIEKLRRNTRKRVMCVARKVGASESWIDTVVNSLLERAQI